MSPVDPMGPTRDAGLVPGGIVCRPARRDELAEAVRLLLSVPGRAAEDGRVAEFFAFAVERRIDVGRAWVAADRAGRLAWAVLPIVSPGRTALLVLPADLPRGAREEVCGDLVAACCESAGASGVQLAQVLLDPADLPARHLFAGRGFMEMAELIYLHVPVRRRAPMPRLPPTLRWVGYSASTHDDFRATVAASYERSLDCPALNGMRDVDDVIAGHMASGEFDPAMWLLLVEAAPATKTSRPPTPPIGGPTPTTLRRGSPPGATGSPTLLPGELPLAVLLLSRVIQSDAVELVYLGLPPSCRGRGVGSLVVKQALALTAQAGRASLTLAVDAANAPALRLYYRHGMQRLASKLAMMRDLRPAAQAGPSGSQRP